MATEATKGNPAAKRALNVKAQATRQRSWLRCQKRKDRRRAAQKAAEERNRELRAQGLPTPYEAAKAAAKLRKAATEEAIK